MQLSNQGIDFIVSLEGSVPTMYNDNAGNCTIGVGHLIHRGKCIYPLVSTTNVASLTTEEMEYLAQETSFTNGLSDGEIRYLLIADATPCAQVVSDRVTVQLTQNQFDALVSFCFNVGGDHFANSTLIKRLNLGSYDQVTIELQKWVKSNGVVNPGLANRRRKEADLFDHGNY